MESYVTFKAVSLPSSPGWRLTCCHWIWTKRKIWCWRNKNLTEIDYHKIDSIDIANASNEKKCDAIFDSVLSWEVLVNSISKSTGFNLFNISWSCRHLTANAAKIFNNFSHCTGKFILCFCRCERVLNTLMWNEKQNVFWIELIMNKYYPPFYTEQ